jgi:Transglycosylase SLT domain
MSVMQATSQFAGGAGFGGNVAGNTMLHSYFAKNGGIPKTREALEAQLGVKYATLSSAEQKQFDDALDAAQHGDEASFFSLLQPWLNDPDRMKRFAEGSGLVPRGGYMNPLLGGAYTGLTPWQYNQGAAAKGLTPHMHEQFMQAAGGDPHLTAILEAIGSHESGFNARAVPRDKHGRLLSSARGIMQLTKATAEYEGITADESFDPDKNIAAGSRRFREALAKANGNVDEALARYYLGDQGFEQEGFNGPHNAGAYVRAVKSQIASFEPHGGDDTNPNTVAGSARNNTSDVQAAQSLEGQAAMQASRQAFEALTHIEETAGSTLLAFSGSIASATDEVGKFIKALKDAVGELGGGNSTTPNTARSSAGGNAMPGGPGSLAMP